MARMIKAGKFSKVITLQRQQEVISDYGGVKLVWRNFRTVRASVEPLQGNEFFTAAQSHSETQLRVRIHYIDGVLPTMRVKYGKRFFAITAIIDSKENHRELQLMCKEGVADGR